MMSKYCLKADQAVPLIIDLQEKLMRVIDQTEKGYKNRSERRF